MKELSLVKNYKYIYYVIGWMITKTKSEEYDKSIIVEPQWRETSVKIKNSELREVFGNLSSSTCKEIRNIYPLDLVEGVKEFNNFFKKSLEYCKLLNKNDSSYFASRMFSIIFVLWLRRSGKGLGWSPVKCNRVKISQKEIAEEVDLNYLTVRKYLQKLIADGKIIKICNGFKTNLSFTSSVYIFDMDFLFELELEEEI